MDPFTIALATFGVQKLRGKSTNRALRDGLIAGGIGQLGSMTGAGQSMGLQGFGQIGAGALPGATIGQQFGQTGAMRGIGALFGKTPDAQQTAQIASSGADPGAAMNLVGNEVFERQMWLMLL